MVGGILQSRFGNSHIEFDHFLDALKGFLRQAKQGFHLGFLGGNHLFYGQHGSNSIKKIKIYVALQHKDDYRDNGTVCKYFYCAASDFRQERYAAAQYEFWRGRLDVDFCG